MSLMQGISLPEERSPFTGKGMAVTVALLLADTAPQSLAQLAEVAEVSRPFVTKVVNRLRRHSLVSGVVEQGSRACLVPTRALFDDAARHWPTPIARVLGRPPAADAVPCGGEPALGGLVPSTWDPPLRAYVRTKDDARHLLADYGGQLVEGGAAEWEIAVVDFPFRAGPVPRIVAALELGSTPRGRETLLPHRQALIGHWPSEG
jgi:hypothetical protein